MSVLEILQIIASILLIASVLMQQRGAGMGSFLGGGGSEFYHSRRGFEKWIYRATIVLAVVFLLSNILIIIQK